MKHFFIGALLLSLSGCALSPVGPLEMRERLSTPAKAPEAAPTKRVPLPAITTRSSRDIHMGMGSDGVLRTWGEPEKVDIAGHPAWGQQRWVYYKEIPTTRGYVRQQRIVYFEQNRVVGWETKNP